MTFLEILSLFTNLSPIILTVGIFLGIFCYKKVDTLRKILIFYLCVMLLLDLTARYLGEVYGNNLVLIPIYGFSDLTMFSIFYYFLGIKNNKKIKLFLILILILSAAFTFSEVMKVYNLPSSEFESYSKVISTLVIVFLSLGFFLEKIYMKKNISSDMFMLNSGILLFYSLNLIIFLPIDFLINGSELKFYFWLVNLVITLTFHTFLITSIWKNGKIQE